MFNFIKHKYWKSKLNDPRYNYLFEEYKGDEYVAFDTETTGLNPKVDEVLSIGAVKIKGNKVLTSEKFYTYVKPSKEINKESIKIHHIRHCDLEYALEPEVAFRMFLDFVGNRPVVGYYLDFDMAMVNKYISKIIGTKLQNKRVEVSGVYYDYKVGAIPQDHVDLRFDTIMRELKVPSMGKHSAINDAIMTAMIFVNLNYILKRKI